MKLLNVRLPPWKDWYLLGDVIFMSDNNSWLISKITIIDNNLSELIQHQ